MDSSKKSFVLRIIIGQAPHAECIPAGSFPQVVARLCGPLPGPWYYEFQNCMIKTMGVTLVDVEADAGNEKLMKKAFGPFLSLAWLGLLGSPGLAHYHMLLPHSPSVKLGKTVAIDYLWGHPFEHQLFDAQAPRSLFVITPDRKKTDLGKTLEPVKVPNGEKKATAYRFHFSPKQRGDFLFVLNSAPVFMKEEKVFFQDTVKVVLHVEDQEGWDARAGQG